MTSIEPYIVIYFECKYRGERGPWRNHVNFSDCDGPPLTEGGSGIMDCPSNHYYGADTVCTFKCPSGQVASGLTVTKCVPQRVGETLCH